MATNVNDVKFRITAEDATAAAFASVNRNLSSIARALLPAFSAVAVVAFVRQAINAADAMNDLHLKTGLAFKDLAAFKLIADQSGSSVEGVANAVKFLSKYMVEHADKLKTIGVTSKDVNGALRQFADTISKIQDPALRTALAVEILGKQGMEMIPVLIGGAAAIEKAEERTRAYTKALEEAAPQADQFNDYIAEAKIDIATLGLEIANTLLPTLLVLSEELKKTDGAFSDMQESIKVLLDVGIKALSVALESLVLIGSDVSFVFGRIGSNIGAVAAASVAAANLEFAEARKILQLMQEDDEKARKALDEFQQRIINPPKSEAKGSGISGDKGLEERARLLLANNDAEMKAAKAAKDFRDAQIKAADAVKASFDPLFVLNKELQSYNEMLARGDISLEIWGEAVLAAHMKADKAIEAMQNTAGTSDPFNVEQAAAYLAIMESVHSSVVSSAQGMASAFGAVGSAIGGMTTALSEFGVTQAAIAAKAAADVQKNPAKRFEIEAAGAQKSGQAQMKMYGDIAGAAKGLFKEKSTGYKVMEAAEKSFRAIEFALAVKAMVMDTTETGQSVLNSGIRAVADGIAGVAKAFGQMGVWGFVGAAAIIAFLAAIGVRMGGGGGGKLPSAAQRQESAGTGSVFGDPTAKSESIANSIKILEENSFKDLEYTNAMLEALRSIENNIEGLVNIVVRQLNLPGGPADTSGLGLGETTKSKMPSLPGASDAMMQWISHGNWALLATKTAVKLLDYGVVFFAQTLKNIEAQGMLGNSYQDVEVKTKSLLGLIKKTKNSTILGPLDEEFSNQVTMVVLSIRDSVLAAADVLGIFGNDLSDFVVDLGSISLKDMTGEQIQEQFEAIFSKLGDDMAKTIFPAVTEFAKVGEGAMETLTRLARNYQIVDLVLSSIGQTFKLVGVESIEARERLIDLSGSIEDFIEQAQAFADTYLTDAQRATPIIAAVLEELGRLGISGVYTLDAFKNLVLSLDLTTAEGAALYAALMKLGPAFALAVNAVHDAAQSYFDLILEAQQFQFQMQQNIANLGTGGGGSSALVGMGNTLIAQYNNVTTTLEDKLEILNQLSGLVGQWVQQKMKEIANERAAIQNAADDRLEILNEQLKIAQQWVSVLNSAKQMLDSMRLTTTNPLPTSGRLNLASLDVARLQQQLAAAAPEDRAEISKKLLDALQKQLGLAQEFYQRPSPEYQAIYNDIIRQVSAIEAEAQENADEALRIQIEISALQEATVEQLKVIDAQLAEMNAQAAAWYAQIAAEGAVVYELLRKQQEADLIAGADAVGQRQTMIDILTEINSKLGVPAPGFAGGLGYVPYDNFAANLHKGERVLTAKESQEYGGGGLSISMPMTFNNVKKEDAQAIADVVDKRVMQLVPVIKRQLKRA